MSRWKPDARGRLEQAAYALFRDRGYEQTTVAEIAAQAGVTERTFFRHYADKREVLFGGSALLEAHLTKALDGLPPAVSTFEAIRIAVEALANLMHGRRKLALERQVIIAAHEDLQERDLIKRAKLTAAVAEALQRRDVPESEARLAADVAMGVFYVGFTNWLNDPKEREFVEVVHAAFNRLQSVAAGN